MLYLSDNVIFLSKVWCKCFYHWLLTDWWQPILTTVRYQWHKKNKKDKSKNISLIDTTHNITLNSTINEWQSFAGSLKIESDLMVSKNMFCWVLDFSLKEDIGFKMLVLKHGMRVMSVAVPGVPMIYDKCLWSEVGHQTITNNVCNPGTEATTHQFQQMYPNIKDSSVFFGIE